MCPEVKSHSYSRCYPRVFTLIFRCLQFPLKLRRPGQHYGCRCRHNMTGLTDSFQEVYCCPSTGVLFSFLINHRYKCPIEVVTAHPLFWVFPERQPPCHRGNCQPTGHSLQRGRRTRIGCKRPQEYGFMLLPLAVCVLNNSLFWDYIWQEYLYMTRNSTTLHSSG